jgi:3'(2'), 5'-bisphosphate nucleotidase
VNIELEKLLVKTVEIAESAGQLLLQEKSKLQSLSVEKKKDNTPVTVLDRLLNQFIIEKLVTLTPGLPVVAEEDQSPDYDHDLVDFWCVDPIDGTKALIAGKDDFCINIALVLNGEPCLGVIHAPVLKQTYSAISSGNAFNHCGDILSSASPDSFDDLRLITSHFNSVDSLIKRFAPQWFDRRQKMSSALKYCSIAAGQADVYLRVGPTSLWDVAAGQVILQQAGGIVVDFYGKKLQYRPALRLLNPAFIALGDPAHLPEVMALCQSIKGGI